MFRYLILYIIVLTVFGCFSKNDFSNDNKLPEKQDSIHLKHYKLEESTSKLIDLGAKAWQKGNYYSALEYFSKALEKSDNEEKTATILNNLGLVHWNLGDNNLAMECYDKSQKIAKKLNLERLLGLIYTNQSLIYKEENKYKNALLKGRKAIDLFKKIDSPRDLAIAYNNYGQIFKKQHKNDSAYHNYLNAIKIYKSIDYMDGMAATYFNIAEININEKRKKESIQTASKSLDYAFQSNSKLRIGEGYKILSQVFETFKVFDSALYYQQKYTDHKIKYLETQYSKNLAESQAKLGAQVKDLRIQNLENKRIIAQNRWLLLFGIILIGVLIATIITYKNWQEIKMRKKELEMELKNSKEILKVKENELKNFIIHLSQKNKLIKKLKKRISLKSTISKKEASKLLHHKILTNQDWESFKIKFQQIYPDFLWKLKNQNFKITEGEVRFLVLFKINFSNKEMSSTLGISPQSVRVTKMRLKKKLNKQGYDAVEDFLKML